MSTCDEELAAKIERIWQETGPIPKEAVEAFIAAFRRWLEAPSLAKGLPYLLARNAEAVARREAVAAEILRTYTPNQFADFMNRLRPGQYIRMKDMKAKKNMKARPEMKMSVEKAEQLLGTLTAHKLADLIETALEMTPTRMTWNNRLDALREDEVGTRAPAVKTAQPLGHRAAQAAEREKEDRKRLRTFHMTKTAQETRKLLGQSRPRGRPKS